MKFTSLATLSLAFVFSTAGAFSPRHQPPSAPATVGSVCPFKKMFGGKLGSSAFDNDDVAVAAPNTQPKNEPTLLARLGGKDALALVVEIFYDRLFGDDDLARFFANQDKEYLKGHQRKLLAQLFTDSFPKGEAIETLMMEKHDRLIRELGLDEDHFDMVATHLVGSLTTVGAAQDHIDEAVAILSPLRGVFERAATKNQKPALS